uniref:Uncharacterized protein n=1 Tax=Hucho hucho TaxID=62062 RepID=A0A4W5JBZ2_9TELE
MFFHIFKTNRSLCCSMKKDYLSTTHPVEAEISGKLRRVAPSTASTADSNASQTDVSASEEGIDLDDSDSDHVFHRRYLQALLALPSGASRPGERQGAVEERQGGAGTDPFIQASLTANPHNSTLYAVLHTNRCSKPSESSTVEPIKSEVPSSKKVTLVEPTMTSPILVPEPQEGKAASLTPKTSRLQKIAPKPFPPTPSLSPPTPTASPFAVPKPWKKGQKSGGNHWGNAGKVTKGTKVAIAAVTVTSSPVTVAMQPQLDDVEGLPFVSFTSKEALGVHVEDMAPSNTSPVMQEHPEKTDGSRSFVSTTGKTSDLTKIKGWRDKYIRTRVSSQNHNPNRSAFCSDMLNQYLESEAQRIRACADAFSYNRLGSVAYQLPVTSTNYVRTLDSVLKMRAPQPPAFCRPCPLSRKPLLYAALKKPPPPINDHMTPPKAAKPKPKHAPPQGKQPHITPAQGKGRSASVLRPIQVSNSNKTTAAKATAEVKVTSPNAQRSLPGKGAVRRDTSPRV